MVIIRSPCGISQDSALRRVVLPDPVPPATAISCRILTAQARSCAYHAGRDPSSTSLLREEMRFEKRLIVTAGPPKAIGVLTTLTRSPLDKRALTIGLLSSRRRPRGARIRSTTIRICSVVLNTLAVRCITPSRS